MESIKGVILNEEVRRKSQGLSSQLDVMAFKNRGRNKQPSSSSKGFITKGTVNVRED